MQSGSVYVREAGSGPGVVCLHSNASSSSQWRSLMESLAPGFHVLAADSYGAGKSPPWPTNRAVFLRDEVALLEPVFDKVGETFSLVGHSYGAARHFIDFWMGPETWDRMPERNKTAIVASIVNIDGWNNALFGEPTPLHAFSKLDVPVLYMVGKRSPASSRGVAKLLTRALQQAEVVEFDDL
jgi:pimeloyl-ACP methyl ester carboxylesterase